MRALAVLLLALAWGQAWGATYWVDSAGAGTGTANGSSVSNQCAGTADADCTAATGGDTVYLCNAAATVTLADSGVSSANRLTYDTSCPGGTPMSINGAAANDVCLTITGSHINVNGVAGDPWNPTTDTLTKIYGCNRRGIMVRTAVSNVTVRDFESYNHTGPSQGDEQGAGVIVDNVTSVGTTTGVTNVLFEDIYAHDNGAFGFATSTSGSGITCRRCRLDANGALWHGGGAFIHPYRSTLTSGWTDIDGAGAGTAYSREVLSSTDDVDVVYWIDQRTYLTDIGTCGSPASGEFCYTPGSPGVGLFYINIGQSPNGQSIQYRRGPLTNVVIEDSSACNNIASDGTHGAGFQPDDLAGSVIVRRSYACNNEGAGFKAYRNQGTVFESVIAWGNGTDASNSLGDRSGLYADESTATVVRQATLVGNATYGAQQGYGDMTMTNSILAANADYGARAVVGALTLNYSDFFGNVSGSTTTVSGGSVANNNGLALAPALVGGTAPNNVMGFCLTPDSPLLAAGTYLGAWATGYAGHDLGKPPAIGARGPCRSRQPAGVRPAASRTVH